MADTASVLIADDNDDILEVLPEILRIQGYGASTYDPNRPDAAALRREYDVVILDIMMPGRDGFELREEIVKHSPRSQFIVITGHPDREKLDKAMSLGVFTFLTKPFTAEQITYAVMGALRMKRLLDENLERGFEQESGRMGLIGASPAMQRVRREILRMAPLEVPVLVTGESGTGKEVVARCIHQFSRRSGTQLTVVNCAGLSANLVESELFGHVQGAFTGAVKTKYGFFEVSDKGTIFLDEIGEMPLELQSKLLRVLDSGEYHRVGDTAARRTDVRVISATNRDLEAMVREGRFRADLYYRLRGAQIRLPPLRERRTDVPALVGHFLVQDKVAVAPQAMERLQAFEWPGNVRELRMVVESLKGLAENGIITRQAVEAVLPAGETRAGGAPAPGLCTYRDFKANVLAAMERSYFQGLLQSSRGNIAQAARIAAIDRKNFYDKLRQLGISHNGQPLEPAPAVDQPGSR